MTTQQSSAPSLLPRHSALRRKRRTTAAAGPSSTPSSASWAFAACHLALWLAASAPSASAQQLGWEELHLHFVRTQNPGGDGTGISPAPALTLDPVPTHPPAPTPTPSGSEVAPSAPTTPPSAPIAPPPSLLAPSPAPTPAPSDERPTLAPTWPVPPAGSTTPTPTPTTVEALATRSTSSNAPTPSQAPAKYELPPDDDNNGENGEDPPPLPRTRSPARRTDYPSPSPAKAPEEQVDGGKGGEAEGLVLVTRDVPLEFSAVLETSPLDLLQVPGIWEQYILARLQAAYRRDDSAFVQSVYLSLREEEEDGTSRNGTSSNSKTLRRRSVRLLQSSTDANFSTTVVQVQGGSVFQVDQDQMQSFDEGIRDELHQILTQESLQQALLLGDNPSQVESVQVAAATGGGGSSSASPHQPTTVELVIGFFLLFLAVFALAYTLHLLFAKWRKRRRKQKQLQRQQQQFVVVGGGANKAPASPPPPPAVSNASSWISTASGTSALSHPRRLHTLPTSGAESEDSEDYYARRGLTVPSSDGERNAAVVESGDNGDGDDESEFGWELRQAAYLDQAAWEEYEKRQREVRDEAALISRMPPPIALSLSRDDPDQNDRGAAPLDDVDESVVEQGMEVDARGSPFAAALRQLRSFPYGDEKESELLDDRLQDRETVTISAAAAQAAAAAALAYAASDGARLRELEMELALQDDNDAVEWTEAGMVGAAASTRILPSRLQEIHEEEEADFEPYGEHKTLQESWDQDELPTGRPSAFSFLYPFNRQHVSDSTRSSADTQSTAVAVMRGSPTTSSWSTGAAIMGGDPRSSGSGSGDLLGRRLDTYESGDEEDDSVTVQMLREVAQINEYVKRYEQRKQQHRRQSSQAAGNSDPSSSSFLNLSGDTGAASTADDSKSQSVPYEAMDDSTSAARKSPLREERESVTQALVRQRQLQQRQHRVVVDDVGDPALEELESPSGSADGEQDEDDDESQRLGIRRYAVQRPPAPLLAYSPSRTTDSPRSSQPRESRIPRFTLPASGQPRSGPPAPRTAAQIPRRNQAPPPPSGIPQRKAGLSSLRRTQAVLDADDVDTNSPTPFDEAGDARQAKGDPPPKPLFRVSPRARTGNKAEFNDILTMFESKPSSTIVPPTIHWQYEK